MKNKNKLYKNRLIVIMSIKIRNVLKYNNLSKFSGTSLM